MFTLEINGEQAQASVSLWTLVEYESEFGGDLLKDLFASSKEGKESVVFDFSGKNLVSLAKMAWACIRTETPSTPPFVVWSKGVTNIDLASIAPIITQPMIDAFFRFGDGSPTE